MTTSVLALAYLLRDQFHKAGYTQVGTSVTSKDNAGLILKLGEDVKSWKFIDFNQTHLQVPVEKLYKEIETLILRLN